MDVLRWELVLVPFFYHLCHVGEVLRYSRRILVYYQEVVAYDVLQKSSIVTKVFHEWFELLAILLIFQILAGFDDELLDLAVTHFSECPELFLGFF